MSFSSLGKFCKHQAAVSRHTGSVMPSFPPLSSSDCHQMAILALGEKVEAHDYHDFKEETAQSGSRSYFESSINVISKDTCFTDPSVTPEDTAKLDAVESDANFRAAIQMMLHLPNNFGSSKSGTDKILKRLKHVTTSMQWVTFFHTQGVGVNCTYHYRFNNKPVYIYNNRFSMVILWVLLGCYLQDPNVGNNFDFPHLCNCTCILSCFI